MSEQRPGGYARIVGPPGFDMVIHESERIDLRIYPEGLCWYVEDVDGAYVSGADLMGCIWSLLRRRYSDAVSEIDGAREAAGYERIGLRQPLEKATP